MNQFYRIVSLTAIMFILSAGAIELTPVAAAQNRRPAAARRAETSSERRAPESVPGPQIQQAATGSPTGDAPVAVQSATVVAVDVSKSLAPFAPLIRAELLRIIRSTPAGAALRVFAFDHEVRPLFRGVVGLDPTTQLEADIGHLQFNGGGTDIGDTLLAASNEASSAASEAPSLTVLITDGQPRPPRGSSFAGRGMDVLLEDSRLTGDPNHHQLIVRIYGPVRPVTTKTNVLVSSEEPDWPTIFARFIASHSPSPTPTVTPMPQKAERANRLPALLLVILIGSIGAVVGHRALSKYRQNQHVRERDAMLQAVTFEEPADPPDPGRSFSVAVRGTPERFTLDSDHPVVTVGDRLDHDLMVTAENSCARLLMSGSGDDVKVTLENVGQTSVFVGALEVRTGVRQWLPTDSIIEIAVGESIITLKEIEHETVEV